MRVLVLHNLADSVVRYAGHIDHAIHDVTYVTTPARKATLPQDVPMRIVVRADISDKVASILGAIDSLPQPEIVIALSEFDLLAAARVREVLGVPGPTTSDALRVRDKVVMKAAVALAGLRTPYFTPLAEALKVEHYPLPWSGRTVLKPRDGASSKDTYTFPSVDAALDAVCSGDIEVNPDAFEIEEFIDGAVLHIDGLVSASRPLIIQASRYAGTCLAYAEGAPLGSVQIDTGPELVRWALQCLRAVGITDGQFHLEAIETPRGPVFLEVGARCGSVGVVEGFELATGVCLPGAAVRLAVEGAASLPLPRSPASNRRFGWFVFPGHRLGSRFCVIRGEKPFRSDSLVRRWEQKRPDEPVKDSVSYSYANVPLGGVVGPAPTTLLERYITELFQTVTVLPRGSSPRSSVPACGVRVG